MTCLSRTHRCWKISCSRRRAILSLPPESSRPIEMAETETESSGWAYVGVGCLTAVVGLAGGGMLAVLVAKAVGAIRGCTPDPETGAPCAWTTFWLWGALIGLILVPTIA